MAPQVEAGESRVLLADDIALLSNRWRMTFGMGNGGGRTGFEGTSTEVRLLDRRADYGRRIKKGRVIRA